MNPERGETWGNAILFALCSTLFVVVLILMAGCSTANPVAPTSTVGAQAPAPAAQTSRVLTWPDGLWFEHDPNQDEIEVCHTQPRQYCSPDGSTCHAETDFYTVQAPEVCPEEPIE